jgi:hypothetical protein
VIAKDSTLTADYQVNGNDSNLVKVDGGSNVFFSSYGCMLVSLLLTTNWFGARQTTTYWVMLSGFSFTLMASSLFHLRYTDSGDNGSASDVQKCSVEGGADYCNRVHFAAVLGATSTGISLVMALLYKAPVAFHLAAGLGIFAAWCAGVVFITFGDGPGEPVSTAFFGTWFALFASLHIATTSVVILVKRREKARRKKDEEKDRVDGGGSGGGGAGPLDGDENEREFPEADDS